MTQQSPNPAHRASRAFFRIAGPIVALSGVAFMVFGVASFFSSFNSMSGPPEYFWCVFVGMPLLFVGLVLCRFGYMGAMAGYVAKELTPVGRDTFNELASAIQPGIRDVSQSIAQGIRAGMATPPKQVLCSRCGTANDADARFCKKCGASLATPDA